MRHASELDLSCLLSAMLADISVVKWQQEIARTDNVFSFKLTKIIKSHYMPET